MVSDHAYSAIGDHGRCYLLIIPKSTMSIQNGAQKFCQKSLGFRGYGGEMLQEGRGEFGEVNYHFAVKFTASKLACVHI
jgi:hypothetical protein